MTDSTFNNYLSNQSNFRARWEEYLEKKPNFSLSDRVNALTPFHGTPHFKVLTEKNKNDLFLNNIRLMAEGLIIFEQTLMYGYFHNRNKPQYKVENFSKPYAQFTTEELFHSMAFQHFLKIHDVFTPFPEPLLMKTTWMKNAFAFIVRYFPSALYISSPRLEALSLSYYLELNRAFGPDADNSWLALHKLHYQDEIYHIPLNYHFHDNFISEHGVAKTLFGSILFFIMVQVMLLKAAHGAVSQSFPEKGLSARIMWTMRYIKWNLKHTPSHKEARGIMKKYIHKLKPKYSSVFSFLIK